MFSSELPTNDSQENKDQASTQIVFKTLLEAQQIIDDPDFDNIALQLAACAGDITTAEVLLNKNANINFESKDRPAPLLLAVEHNQANMVQFLLEKKANTNLLDAHDQPPLISAVAYGSYDAVKVLLNNPVDVDMTEKTGMTALNMAIFGYAACIQANSQKSTVFLDIIKLLLTKNPSISKQSQTGISPMSLAIDLDTTEVLKLILNSKPNVDLNFNSRKLQSPLHEAVMAGKEEVCRMLLNNKNISIDRLDDLRLPPIYYAIHTKNYKIMQLLIDHGANLMLRCGKNNTITIADKIRSSGNATMLKMLVDWNSNKLKQQNREACFSSPCSLM